MSLSFKKTIFTSNYSTKEQEHFIHSFFKKQYSVFTLLNKEYTVFKLHSFYFGKETVRTLSGKNLNPQIYLNIKILQWIIKKLQENKVHRNFKIEIKDKQVKVIDILFVDSFSITINSSLNRTFFIDSRFFSLFKLNQKTLTNRSELFLSENKLILLLKRKKENFLCIQEI